MIEGAAEVMDSDNKVGAVETGLRADLILVDGRPDQYMGDIRRVDWVMRGGTVYDVRKILGAIGVRPRE